MNRRKPLLYIGIIIFAALFYFTGDSCNGLEVNKAAIINIHYERGVRFYKQHEYDKAISELGKVLELEPGHLKAKKYLAAATKDKNKRILEQLCKLADVFYKHREYQKAMDTYKRALEIVPRDAYVSYRMELLQAKIERLEERKKKTPSKLKQSTKELERLAKERERRQRQLKKQAELELNREEKERQKKKTVAAKEDREMEDIKQDKAPTKNISLESKTMPNQKAKPVKRALKPPAFMPLKDIGQDVLALEQLKELEKLYRIKFLFELGEKYYKEGEYRRATEAFRQVIDLESGLKTLYAPYAQNYIEKIREKLQEELSKDMDKEIQDMEKDMIDKIIDSKRVSTEIIK